MKAAAFGLAVALWAPCASIADEVAEQAPDAYLGVEPSKWGAPRVIVAPEYPADALAHGVKGSVTVGGFISPEGAFVDPQYTVDPPDATALIQSVKDVIGLWVFYPFIKETCLPTTSPVLMQVWFEIRDGAPHISVSRDPTATKNLNADPALKAVKRVDPEFPRLMIRQGLSAKVYARTEVDPAGNVTRVVAKVFPIERYVDRSDFEVETEQALRQWKYTEAAAGFTRTRVVCYEVVFNLRR
jgi:hypothetical protein